MGHYIQLKSRVLGSTQSIALKGKLLEGSADSRRHGAAAISQKP
jgi:gamma-glutamyltranspeptidase